METFLPISDTLHLNYNWIVYIPNKKRLPLVNDYGTSTSRFLILRENNFIAFCSLGMTFFPFRTYQIQFSDILLVFVQRISNLTCIRDGAHRFQRVRFNLKLIWFPSKTGIVYAQKQVGVGFCISGQKEYP